MLNLKTDNVVVRLIYSTLIATFFALVLLLLFSFLASLFGASATLVKVFKVVIRLLSVALSAFLFVKNDKGILCGALSGLSVGVFVQLLFLLFSRSFNLASFLLNCLFCIIFGIFFGIIFVNLKNMRNYSWKNSKNSI